MITFCPIKSSFASSASSVSRPCAHAASCLVLAPAFLKLRPQPRRHGSFDDELLGFSVGASSACRRRVRPDVFAAGSAGVTFQRARVMHSAHVFPTRFVLRVRRRPPFRAAPFYRIERVGGPRYPLAGHPSVAQRFANSETVAWARKKLPWSRFTSPAAFFVSDRPRAPRQRYPPHRRSTPACPMPAARRTRRKEKNAGRRRSPPPPRRKPPLPAPHRSATPPRRP